MRTFIQMLLGMNVVSIGNLVRFMPNQFMRSCIRSYSVCRNIESERLMQIPELSLEEILGHRQAKIKLSIMRYEDRMLPINQAVVLLSILVAEAPVEVLEIGTYMGHTTLQMATNVEWATVHTVDLPENFSVECDPDNSLPKDDFHLIARRIAGKSFKESAHSSHIVQHFAEYSQLGLQQGRKSHIFLH